MAKTTTGKATTKVSKKGLTVEANETAAGMTRYTVEGVSVCTFLRNAGFMGYSVKQLREVLTASGLDGLSNSTVSCQAGAGWQERRGLAPHHAGGAEALPADVAAKLAKLTGGPEKDVPKPAKKAKAQGKKASAKVGK